MELNKEIGSFSADLAFFDNLQHKYVLGAKIENAKEEIDSQKSLYDQAYLVGRGWNMYYMFYPEFYSCYATKADYLLD